MQFIYSRRFKKEFSLLPAKIQKMASARLTIFSQNTNHPILNNHFLSGEYRDCRSINITGNYRIILQMIDGDVCYLIALGTHTKLYE
ncbi:MAG: type II toxin-antitoxin system mRNA interferase toxin, RelE/StbE family [Parcubacteria group bacterium]|nr:type II toxin-antitoxin system mRNA interferase toxin, RelE/StbE family [Parcubacteria group bacterium]